MVTLFSLLKECAKAIIQSGNPGSDLRFATSMGNPVGPGNQGGCVSGQRGRGVQTLQAESGRTVQMEL